MGPAGKSPPEFENQTIRMVVRMTIGGDRLRVRFSNEFGTAPLTIGAARLALVRKDGAIIPETDRALTFNGDRSVQIPAGAPMLSDAANLDFPQFAEIAVSIYLPSRQTASTFHQLGQHETYLGSGDLTGSEQISNPSTTNAWYFLASVETAAPATTGAVVAFGDSITDGFGAKVQYGDWPNQLVGRLGAEKGTPALAVDNEGIGGNRVLHDGAGVDALARMDRDVFSLPAVRDLIVLEGINDIGWPSMKPRKAPDGTMRENPWAKEQVDAKEIIAGLKQIIDRAHEHGIRVFGATMTPYEGADYYTPDGEVIREAVNQWIRTGNAFDGVFDFDAAVRDPSQPTKFREDMQTGDHLHPNASGYKAMAAAIDLKALRGK